LNYYRDENPEKHNAEKYLMFDLTDPLQV